METVKEKQETPAAGGTRDALPDELLEQVAGGAAAKFCHLDTECPTSPDGKHHPYSFVAGRKTVYFCEYCDNILDRKDCEAALGTQA